MELEEVGSRINLKHSSQLGAALIFSLVINMARLIIHKSYRGEGKGYFSFLLQKMRKFVGTSVLGSKLPR